MGLSFQDFSTLFKRYTRPRGFFLEATDFLSSLKLFKFSHLLASEKSLNSCLTFLNTSLEFPQIFNSEPPKSFENKLFSTKSHFSPLFELIHFSEIFHMEGFHEFNNKLI